MNSQAQTAIIEQKLPHWWRSVREIRSAESFAYKKALPQTIVIEADLANRKELSSAIEQLRANSVRRLIVLTNDFPEVERLSLAIASERNEVSEIYFHIDGSFSTYVEAWHRTLENLQGKKVCFVVSTRPQAELVKALTRKSYKVDVHVCPFPVAKIEAPTRTKARAKLGLARDEIALVYVGRVSAQKNINLLIRFFGRYSKSQKTLRLFIAGPFDDLNGNHERPRISGAYFAAFEKWYAKLPHALTKQITFLGDLSKPEVGTLLAAADLFVSLSTFHDEDFGMAAAEALLAGCPTLLTRWGGYQDFAGEAVALVPVRFGKRKLELDYAAFANGLDRLTKLKNSRAKIRRAHGSVFSMNTVISRYRALHRASPSVMRPKKASALSPTGLRQLSRSLALYGNTYRAIYSTYVKPPKRNRPGAS